MNERYKANWGREIFKLTIENMPVSNRLKARKDRLAEMMDSFTLREDDKIFEAIFDLAKADGWDFVKDGPQGLLDNSTLSNIVDRCLIGKINVQSEKSWNEKPSDWLEWHFFKGLQSQLDREGLTTK